MGPQCRRSLFLFLSVFPLPAEALWPSEMQHFELSVVVVSYLTCWDEEDAVDRWYVGGGKGGREIAGIVSSFFCQIVEEEESEGGVYCLKCQATTLLYLSSLSHSVSTSFCGDSLLQSNGVIVVLLLCLRNGYSVSAMHPRTRLRFFQRMSTRRRV